MREDVIRLDAPLDYRIIWNHLIARLKRIAGEEAEMAALAMDEVAIRRHQGGYKMVYRIIEEMSRLVEHEKNPAAQGDNIH